MSMNASLRSLGIGTMNAVIYEAVDTAAQYTNTLKQVTGAITNGQLFLIGVGVLASLLGWFGLKSNHITTAATGFSLGPLFIVVAISNMLKNKMASSTPALGNVARISARPALAPAPAPAPASSFYSPAN